MARNKRLRRAARRQPLPGKDEGRFAKPGTGRHDLVIAVGLLSLLSILAFGNTLQNNFAYDDEAFILRNQIIRRLDQLPTIFTTRYTTGDPEYHGATRGPGGVYRPLVVATFALNYAVGGFRPLDYHLVNVILHVAVSLLLYALARQLGLARAGALAASALFAVHPLHTEAVTAIVGRAELLMALGVLLALKWYPKQDAGPRQLRSFLLSLGAFAVALLSKEQAAMLPALLVLYELATRSGREPWRVAILGTLRRSAGYILVLGAYVALRAMVLGTVFYRATKLISFVDNPLAHVSWDQRLFTALKVAGKYLWLFVWPAKLSADYSYNAIPVSTSLFEPAVFAALLVWGSLLALAAYAYVGRASPVFFGIGLTALAFLPTSNLFVPIGTIMGERLFYLPSAGLCLVAGAAWERVAARPARPESSGAVKWTGLGVLATVLLLLSVRTMVRNRDWRNTETILRSAVAVVPESAKVHYDLGVVAAVLEKDPKQALQKFDEALRIYPAYPAQHSKVNAALGAVLLRTGQTQRAIEFLERAVKLLPAHLGSRYNLGLAYAKQGRWQDAEAAYRRALALDPGYARAHMGLGAVFLTTGRTEQAIEALKRAVQLDPKLPEAHHNLGVAYAKQGRWQDAEAAYRRALALDPGDPPAHSNLSALLHEQRRYTEALAEADAAVRLSSTFVEAHYNRARALQALGRDREAAAAYEGVLALRPDFLAAKQQLDWLRRRQGR